MPVSGLPWISEWQLDPRLRAAVPRYALRKHLHDLAVEAGCPRYQDPFTNDYILTEAFLTTHPSLCLHNEERHCPHIVEQEEEDRRRRRDEAKKMNALMANSLTTGTVAETFSSDESNLAGQQCQLSENQRAPHLSEGGSTSAGTSFTTDVSGTDLAMSSSDLTSSSSSSSRTSSSSDSPRQRRHRVGVNSQRGAGAAVTTTTSGRKRVSDALRVTTALKKRGGAPPRRIVPPALRPHGAPLVGDTIPDIEDIRKLPRYSQHAALHARALTLKHDCYRDVNTGVLVFTRDFLLQGPCCGEDCRHCPYGHHLGKTSNERGGVWKGSRLTADGVQAAMVRFADDAHIRSGRNTTPLLVSKQSATTASNSFSREGTQRDDNDDEDAEEAATSSSTESDSESTTSSDSSSSDAATSCSH